MKYGNVQLSNFGSFEILFLHKTIVIYNFKKERSMDYKTEMIYSPTEQR